MDATDVGADGLTQRDAVPAQRPPESGDITVSFAHALWRLGAAHVSECNSVQLLDNGPATFDAMLAQIDTARTQVALESYIIRSDEVGERFSEALIAAAARGVDVRVVYDWIGSRGISRSFVERLRHNGIQVVAFNRPSLRRRWFGLLPRDHRKLLVVDGKTDHGAGVIGGVGLGHEWVRGTAEASATQNRRQARRHRWRDTAVTITGPATAAMQHAFERTWARGAGGARLDSDASRPPPEQAPAQTAVTRPALVGIIEGEPGRFRVARALQINTVLARRTIWIADAYFMPSFAEVEALAGAAQDAVDVRLLVPGQSDHPWMITLTRRSYARLLRAGVRIWEWKGEMMHAKTSVVDGRFARIGSTDYNPLGMAINYELDAVIDDLTLGAAMNAMFLDDVSRSREILRPP